MEIKTLHRIYDDRGVECCIGDIVLLQTKEMDDPMLATIENIMTNVATFLLDDRSVGYVPIKARPADVVSITLYQKRPTGNS